MNDQTPTPPEPERCLGWFLCRDESKPRGYCLGIMCRNPEGDCGTSRCPANPEDE